MDELNGPNRREVEKEAALKSNLINEIGDQIFCRAHPELELVEAIVLAEGIKEIIAVKCPACGEKFRYSKLAEKEAEK